MDLLNRTPPKADKRLAYGQRSTSVWRLVAPAGYGGQACTVAGVRAWRMVARRIRVGLWRISLPGDQSARLCGLVAGVPPGGQCGRRLARHHAGCRFGHGLRVGVGEDVFHWTRSEWSQRGTPPVGIWRSGWRGGTMSRTTAHWLSQLQRSCRGVWWRWLVAVDLRVVIELCGGPRFVNGKPSTIALMGGTPEGVPERYRAADPGELLPLMVPQKLVQGTKDGQIPAEVPARWKQAAERQGDQVEVTMVDGANHFDVVDPESKAWPASRDCYGEVAAKLGAARRQFAGHVAGV